MYILTNLVYFARIQPKLRCISLRIALLFLFSTMAVQAKADDFDKLVTQSMNTGETVSVIVTGWQAITGDNIFQTDIDAYKSGNFVSITGDELLKELQTVSPNTRVTRKFRGFEAYTMEMDAKALQHAKANNPNLTFVENFEISTFLQETTKVVGAPLAWNVGASGQGKIVVVIDNGIDTDHPFLKHAIIGEACTGPVCPNGEDFMFGPGAARPFYKVRSDGSLESSTHGTHVAGIVAGLSSTEKLAGIAPDARIFAINAMGGTGTTSFDSLVEAIFLAGTIANDTGEVAAINMSLGWRGVRARYGHCEMPAVDRIVNAINNMNVAIIAAAGNGSELSKGRIVPVSYPACMSGVLSVGSVKNNGDISDFSNSGPALDFYAPGDKVVSSVVYHIDKGRRGFEAFPGTSMSAPHVAGAYAAIMSKFPGIKVDDVTNALKATGRSVIEPHSRKTIKMINIHEAILALNRGGIPEENQPRTDTKPAQNDTQWQAITD